MVKLVLWTIGICLGLGIPYFIIKIVFLNEEINLFFVIVITTVIHGILMYCAIKVFHFIDDPKHIDKV